MKNNSDETRQAQPDPKPCGSCPSGYGTTDDLCDYHQGWADASDALRKLHEQNAAQPEGAAAWGCLDHHGIQFASEDREQAVEESRRDGSLVVALYTRHAEVTECNWKDDEDGFWQTDCGRSWVFDEGSPADNDVKFCMGCGRRAALAALVKP